jgi:uncharacterized membrane protein
MKSTWQVEVPQWLLLAGMFLLAVLTWPWAPDRIPVHWNAGGQVDRFGGKVEGLLLIPSVALAVYALMLLLPRVDPARANYPRFTGAYSVIRTSILAVLAILYGLIHLTIRGYRVDIARAVPLLVGGLFMVLGGVMGRIQPNWFVGIRTPWTLSSKLAWTRTHRLGGWMFIGVGLITGGLGVVRTRWALAVLIAALLATVALLSVYSYRTWRSDPEKVPAGGTLPGSGTRD